MGKPIRSFRIFSFIGGWNFIGTTLLGIGTGLVLKKLTCVMGRGNFCLSRSMNTFKTIFPFSLPQYPYMSENFSPHP